MRAVLNNIAALSQFAVNYGIQVDPIGPKKKEAEQAPGTSPETPTGTSVLFLVASLPTIDLFLADSQPTNENTPPAKKTIDKVRHWDVAGPAEPVYVFQLDVLSHL